MSGRLVLGLGLGLGSGNETTVQTWRTMASLLSRAEIGRYGRQMILPEWGVEGEVRTTPQLHHAPVICIPVRDKPTYVYASQAARLLTVQVNRMY